MNSTPDPPYLPTQNPVMPPYPCTPPLSQIQGQAAAEGLVSGRLQPPSEHVYKCRSAHRVGPNAFAATGTNRPHVSRRCRAMDKRHWQQQPR